MFDNSTEEVANGVIEGLRHLIDVESQIIVDAHELHIKLCTFDDLINYVDDSLPKTKGTNQILILNHVVHEGILEIREYIDKNNLMDIQFVAEKKKNLKKLSEDVAHKNWQAVKSDIDESTGDIKGLVRVGKEHLKGLHKRFAALVKEMSENKIIRALEKDFAGSKIEKDYLKKEKYYFSEIYKFLQAYETILSHLLSKEDELTKKMN